MHETSFWCVLVNYIEQYCLLKVNENLDLLKL